MNYKLKTKNSKALMLLTISIFFSFILNAHELYIGANYHPHDDKNLDKIKSDIGLMKDAGFNVVRMGHLARDSYDPAEGQFDFEWFDTVMDLMDQAGIKVILDFAIRPAPLWLHYKYPSIDIVDENGCVQYPNEFFIGECSLCTSCVFYEKVYCE